LAHWHCGDPLLDARSLCLPVSELELKRHIWATNEQAEFSITVFQIIIEPAIPKINVEPLGDVEFKRRVDIPGEVATDTETAIVAAQLVGQSVREPQLHAASSERNFEGASFVAGGGVGPSTAVPDAGLPLARVSSGVSSACALNAVMASLQTIAAARRLRSQVVVMFHPRSSLGFLLDVSS
jgi:hypothetical protein